MMQIHTMLDSTLWLDYCFEIYILVVAAIEL
jgi:hypothetical protein